jgi:ABC-2 type transport system ATP-binding protein
MPATAPRVDVDGVLDVRLNEIGILVTAAGGSRLAPAVMRQLESRGHTVTSLDVRPASLEEVFVDMTREEREPAYDDQMADVSSEGTR